MNYQPHRTKAAELREMNQSLLLAHILLQQQSVLALLLFVIVDISRIPSYHGTPPLRYK